VAAFTDLWRISCQRIHPPRFYLSMAQHHRKSAIPRRIWQWVLWGALACLIPGPLRAQLGVTTFGLQVKPVIPFGFF
jgi:hypothetical protein